MLTLCFLIANSGKAQNRVKIMPQIGINLTKTPDNRGLESSKFRPGIEGGVWIQTPKTIFIMPGLFFGQQGLNEVSIKDIKTNKDTLISNIDYRTLKLPVMFGVQALGARLYTGPNFTYVINVDNIQQISTESFKDLTMGLCLGVGLNIAFFSFDARYEYGVSHTFSNQNTTTNTFTISAGLKF